MGLDQTVNTWPKIFEIVKNEYPMSNKECPMMKFSFDVHYSLFDILRFKRVIQTTEN